MTKRAVLYARVCVDDGENLTKQLEACREHAQALDWNIVEELAEQGAGSGSSSLPQLDHMLELVRAGIFDVLVVRDRYRLSRKLARLLSLEAQLARHGIGLEYWMPGNSVATYSVLQAIGSLPAWHRRRKPMEQEKGAGSHG